jgi:hypothetical protein
LAGLTVSSSATRLIHAEQVMQLDGPVRIGVSSQGLEQVENRTQLKLRDATMVRRSFDANGKARYDGCWLGEINPNSSAVIGMRRLMWDPSQVPFAEDRARVASNRTEPVLNVDAVLQLAFKFADKHDPFASRREETRLVAVVDDVLPGMNVDPAASQRSGATVVIAHLAYGNMPASRPDVNSPDDVVTATEDNEESL